jgi:hypothetical protein
MAASADVRLINPSEKQLTDVLKRAHKAANRGVRITTVKLERDAAFWGRFARECMREREGRRRSCKAASWQTPEVIAGWWTDPANRQHFRVMGRTRGRWGYNRPRREGELRSLPPWWQVYPESVLAVRQPNSEGETYLACCRCGKVGSPESLGWMGDTCGPCFDRRADGGIPATGFGHFSGWGAGYARIGFALDRSSLVGLNRTNKFRAVSLLDGSERRPPKDLRGAVVTSVGVAEGFILGTNGGAVYRWDGADGLQPLLGAQVNSRCVLSSDGHWAICTHHNTIAIADLTVKDPAYTAVDGRRVYNALHFAPTSDCLFALSMTNELLSIEPETLAEKELRDAVFAGLSPYGYPRDLAIAPDKSAIVVVRENYPSTTSVRVIPVNVKHPMFDLAIPSWHRPSGVAIAPDGKHIATADQQAGWVGFWRLPSGKSLGYVRAVPEAPSYRGGQISFSPDGRALAVSYLGAHQEHGSTVVVWPWPEVLNALA